MKNAISGEKEKKHLDFTRYCIKNITASNSTKKVNFFQKRVKFLYFGTI